MFRARSTAAAPSTGQVAGYLLHGEKVKATASKIGDAWRKNASAAAATKRR